MAVRVVRFEIKRVLNADTSERFAAWSDLSRACQAIANEFYKRWELWHFQNGSAAIVAKWQDEWRAYKQDKGPNPGKCPVDCFEGFEASCNPTFYKQAADKFQGLYTSNIPALLKRIKDAISSKPATHGSFPYWQAVVLDQERRPCHTGTIPIPFIPDCCELPESIDDGKCVLKLTIERTGIVNGRGKGVVDEIELVTKARRMGSQLAVLKHLISLGDDKWAFKGSCLHYNDKKNKWFALLCYELPERKASHVNPDKVAILRPEEFRPWTLVIGDREIPVAGWGNEVRRARQRNLTLASHRNSNYRFSGSASRGHGYERATAARKILSRSWLDFVKTHNHTTTKRVVEICEQEGVGTIIYKQPTDFERDKLFLVRAGQLEGRPATNGWDWCAVQTDLKYKANPLGINVTNERTAGSKSKAKKPRQKKPVKAHA